MSLILVFVALAGCSSGTSRSAAAGGATATPSASAPAPVAGSSAAAAMPAPVVVPIPAKYQQLYDNLSSNLDGYQTAITAMPAVTTKASAAVAGAELLPANGNRLKALLAPATMRAVDAWLDRFHAMGVRGVTVGVKLPLLVPRFGPDAGAYANFYATAADHARTRGMSVDVELGALFCDTVYATCTSPFSGSYDQFVSDTVTQARTVIDRMRPDLLNILSEPTTQASLAGVEEFKTPAGVGRYVRDVLAGIGDRGTTKVGAGAASWLGPEYNQQILQEDVDFLAVHIYPVNPQIVANVVTDTALAGKAGKPIVADEIGLYKTDKASAAGAATADSVYRLDSFSFFQPLDIRFLTITAEWAQKAGVTYLSPFWAGQFFAYLGWNPATDALASQALTQTANSAISEAFKSGRLTDYGRLWPSVLRG